MLDTQGLNPPSSLEAIKRATKVARFTMASEPRTGSLLRTLEDRDDLRLTRLNWSTGLIVAVKR